MKKYVLGFLLAIGIVSNFYGSNEKYPSFELWNKTNSPIRFVIINDRFPTKQAQNLLAGKWYTTELDLSKPTTLKVHVPHSQQVHIYTFTPGKNIFVRVKEDVNGNVLFGPQTGPFMGFTSVTERGYPKNINVSGSDISAKIVPGSL